MQPNGLILWQGISRIDGKTPIVVIASGLNKASSNSKTGGMVQTYILLANEHPIEGVNNGNDSAICGGCVHRKMPTGKRSCYVNIVFGGPGGVWRAFRAGGYETATDLAGIGAGKFVRIGTYGDPAAVPLEVWQSLISLSAGHTGYTHQWRSAKFAGLSSYVQASCETAEDVAKANGAGWKTFRVVPLGDTLPTGAVNCPASAEQGKGTSCADCLLCDGRSADVVIYSHGPGKLNYGRNRDAINEKRSLRVLTVA